MDTLHFITITGIDHYYGKTPFEIGRIARISKEPENPHDPEAIRVELPVIGTIGYVANSTNTVYRGTASAGRIYDKIGDYAFARVFFVTHSSAIALVLSTTPPGPASAPPPRAPSPARRTVAGSGRSA